MRTWVTEFMAICAKSGELKKYCGPNIAGLTSDIAQQWCYDNAGHLKVIGELIAEIPCKDGTYNPDIDNINFFGSNNDN